MQIEIVTPAPPRSHNGNRVTALRWARLLTELGHQVAVTTAWSRTAVGALVVLHARRGADAARAFAEEHPDCPLIVALTGTDLYRDLPDSPEAQATIDLATALIVLQSHALRVVPRRVTDRVHVIHQSVETPVAGFGHPASREPDDRFDVVFLAHLREVKDPFLPAEATRVLPAASRVRVTHLGAAIEDGMAARARAESVANPRYRWVGDVRREQALERMASSDLLVLTSRVEGGANVVSEALATGTPVLSTRVGGSIGLLGEDYPGFFDVGDAAGLAGLLGKAEQDSRFMSQLRAHVDARRDLVRPEREREAWSELLRSLTARLD